jgi:uncharacterized protein (TIGR03083 family)
MMIDTRPFFRPLAQEFVPILRRLPRDAWDRPTAAGSWTVRDVLAHLVDGTMRRLSFHRDGETPPSPSRPIAGERDLVEFINELNREWVALARRFSPRLLTDLYASASLDLATFFEGVPLDAPALFGVSWAGEAESMAWFDIGREFTEHWHHQAQIREAVGEPPPSNPEWLRAVLKIAMRGVPHAYRDFAAPEGATVTVEATGESGGIWTLRREGEGWTLGAGRIEAAATARVVTSADTLWRLLFNGLHATDAEQRLELTGMRALTLPLLRARSVIV